MALLGRCGYSSALAVPNADTDGIHIRRGFGGLAHDLATFAARGSAGGPRRYYGSGFWKPVAESPDIVFAYPTQRLLVDGPK